MNLNFLIILLLIILLCLISILISQYCININIGKSGGGWGKISNDNYTVRELTKELHKIVAEDAHNWNGGVDRLRIIVTKRVYNINKSPPRITDLFTFCSNGLKDRLNEEDTFKSIKLIKSNDQYTDESPDFGVFLLALGALVTEHIGSSPNKTIDLFAPDFINQLIGEYIKLLQNVKKIILENNKNNLNLKYLIDAYNKAVAIFIENGINAVIPIEYDSALDTEKIVGADKIHELIDLYESLEKKCNDNNICKHYLQENNIDKIDENFEKMYKDNHEDILYDVITSIYNKAIGLDKDRQHIKSILQRTSVEIGESDEDEFEIEDTKLENEDTELENEEKKLEN